MKLCSNYNSEPAGTELGVCKTKRATATAAKLTRDTRNKQKRGKACFVPRF